MAKYIIETITKDGMRVSSLPLRLRLKRPKPGDLVQLPDGNLGMIERDWPDMGGYHVCVGGRSAFMSTINKGDEIENHISISGGPFRVIPYDHLKPTYYTTFAQFWTWATRPQADGGVSFKIDKPVFKEIPSDPEPPQSDVGLEPVR